MILIYFILSSVSTYSNIPKYTVRSSTSGSQLEGPEDTVKAEYPYKSKWIRVGKINKRSKRNNSSLLRNRSNSVFQ